MTALTREFWYLGTRGGHLQDVPLLPMENMFYHGEVENRDAFVRDRKVLQISKNIHWIGPVTCPNLGLVVKDEVVVSMCKLWKPAHSPVIINTAFDFPYGNNDTSYKSLPGYSRSGDAEIRNYNSIARRFRCKSPTLSLTHLSFPFIDRDSSEDDKVSAGRVEVDSLRGASSYHDVWYSPGVIRRIGACGAMGGIVLHRDVLAQLQPHLNERYFWWASV